MNYKWNISAHFCFKYRCKVIFSADRSWDTSRYYRLHRLFAKYVQSIHMHLYFPSSKVYELQMKHIAHFCFKYRWQGDFSAEFDHETLADITDYIDFSLICFKVILYATIISPSYKVYELQMKHICSYLLKEGCQGDFSADSIMRHLADITDYIDFSLNMFSKLFYMQL